MVHHVTYYVNGPVTRQARIERGSRAVAVTASEGSGPYCVIRGLNSYLYYFGGSLLQI